MSEASITPEPLRWKWETLTVAYWMESAGDHTGWIACTKEGFIAAQGQTKAQARSALLHTIAGNALLDPERFSTRASLPGDLAAHFEDGTETWLVLSHANELATLRAQVAHLKEAITPTHANDWPVEHIVNLALAHRSDSETCDEHDAGDSYGSRVDYDAVTLKRRQENEQLRAQVAQQAESVEDARMGHVRLDETRAKSFKAPLYERIGWIIELLSRERDEYLGLRLAAESEREARRADLFAAEHRITAAANAERTSKMLLEQAEATVAAQAQQTHLQQKIAILEVALHSPDAELLALREAVGPLVAQLEQIANVAWHGYGQSKDCKRIYEICRDQIGVTAGTNPWRAESLASALGETKD
jgi:hypothetical protein